MDQMIHTNKFKYSQLTFLKKNKLFFKIKKISINKITNLICNPKEYLNSKIMREKDQMMNINQFKRGLLRFQMNNLLFLLINKFHIKKLINLTQDKDLKECNITME